MASSLERLPWRLLGNPGTGASGSRGIGRRDSPHGCFGPVRAHWLDLGAKDPAYVLDSTDMHQEGLVLPGTKIVKRGRIDHEVSELVDEAVEYARASPRPEADEAFDYVWAGAGRPRPGVAA